MEICDTADNKIIIIYYHTLKFNSRRFICNLFVKFFTYKYSTETNVLLYYYRIIIILLFLFERKKRLQTFKKVHIKRKKAINKLSFNLSAYVLKCNLVFIIHLTIHGARRAMVLCTFHRGRTLRSPAHVEMTNVFNFWCFQFLLDVSRHTIEPVSFIFLTFSSNISMSLFVKSSIH